MKPQEIIEMCYAHKVESEADVRQVFDWLAAGGMTHHPDDDPLDIVWNIALSVNDKSKLRVVMDEQFAACHDLGLDIYEEAMNADVRQHGKASPFYQEETTND